MKRQFSSFVIIVSLVFSLLLAGSSCSKEALRSVEEETPAEGSAAGQDKEEGSSDDRSSDSGEIRDSEDVDWSKYNPDEWLVGFGAEIATEMGKTAITITDGKSIWVADDEIKVYSNDGKSGTYKYVSLSNKFVPVSESDILPAGKIYYAVYPASVCTSQTSTDGQIAIDLAGAATSGSVETGNISGSAAPMASKFIAKEKATFHNIGEVLVVRMYGTENVKSLTVSNAGSQLASNGTVDFSEGTPSFSPSTGKMDSVISFEDGSCPKLKADEPTDFYFIMLPGQSLTNLQFKTEFSQQVGGAGTYYHPVVTQNTTAFSSSAMNHMTRVKLHTHYFSGGDGSAGSPYLIKTVADLQSLATFVNSTVTVNDVDNNTFFRNASYELAGNINMSGESFAGIGGTKSQEPLAFSGKFNGQKSSYSISNLSHGLFNYISGASISNVKLTGVNWTIASGNNYGALAGSMKGGTISGCDVSGSISATSSVTVGGLVGEILDGASVTISGSTANCNVTAVWNVGGLVGFVNNISSGLASIEDCSVGTGAEQVSLTSNLAEGGSNKARVGGLIGGGYCDISGCVVGNDANDTYNVIISASEREVGGLVGYYSGGTISESRVIRASVTSSYPSSTVNEPKVDLGGMVGHLDSGNIIGYSGGATVLNCKIESVYGSNVGGLAGTINNATITSSSATQNLVDCATSDYCIKAYTCIGGVVGRMSSSSSIGEKDHIVKTKVKITAGQAIGGIVGQIDDGCTMSYCTMDSGSFDFTAGIEPAAKNNINLGGIAGYCYGGSDAKTTVSNCNVSAALASRADGYYNNVGGIVGYSSAVLDITSCTMSADVTGGQYVGGIIGMAGATSGVRRDVSVTTCTVSGGTIKGFDRVGGIVGAMSAGSVRSCTSSSAIRDGGAAATTSAPANVGGIVGAITGYVTVYQCTNNGAITISAETPVQNVGGIVGAISNNLSDSEKGKNLKIEECLNAANIQSSGRDVGGIIGQMGSGTISFCRVRKGDDSNYVSISAGGVCAGGIAGLMYSGTINHCYSKCNVVGQYQVGGIVGDCDARDSLSRNLAIIINSISRSMASSADFASGGNCSTGGIVGAMFSNYDNYAIVANSVAMERTIRNTNSAESICIGAIAGYMVRQNPGTKGATRLDNCYSQHNDNSLTYKNGTQCPSGSDKKYGGIFGHLQASQCYNCYYRTGQEGLQNSGAIAKNYTKITTAQKNGTAIISSVTTWNGGDSRTVTGKLWEVLNAASYSGTSGETARKYNTMYSGTQVAFDTWENFNNGQDFYFSIPKGLYDKGTGWYL